MAKDEPPRKEGLSTLPGVLAGLAALITAVTGLLVAIKEAGWLSYFRPPEISRDVNSGGGSNTPSQPALRPQAPANGASEVVLPDVREYRLGPELYTILNAILSSGSEKENTLRFRIRLFNTGGYPAAFLENSFRLVIDGLPSSPVKYPIQLVHADAAKEGEVTFSVPVGVASAKLVIKAQGVGAEGATTSIPIRFAASSARR